MTLTQTLTLNLTLTDPHDAQSDPGENIRCENCLRGKCQYPLKCPDTYNPTCVCVLDQSDVFC